MRGLLVLALLVALGGCLEPAGQGGRGLTPTPIPTVAAPACVRGTQACCKGDVGDVGYGCVDPPLAHLQVESSTATIGVPFPHLDRCLTGDAWMTSQASTMRATASKDMSDRGDVLRVVASGNGRVDLALNLTDWPRCATFRYDPWSIEPDSANGTVEIQADRVASVTVQIRVSDGKGCWTVTTYQGTATAGWSTLQGDEPGTVCA